MTPEQVALLQELQSHPLWPGILKSLVRETPAPWKPKDSSIEQHERWIYDSGRLAENKAILAALLYQPKE